MPEVGIAVTEVLDRLGCDVRYHAAQTCCGQPAFNSGYHAEARAVAEHMLDVFADDLHDEQTCIVVPSGSCGAMAKLFYRELFADSPRADAAGALAARTFEFSEFLADKLGVGDVGARFPHRVTFHDGCHGLRELNIHGAPRRLLAQVRGLELVEMGEAATCCGFGGSFAVKFPQVSTAMGEVKCDSALATEAEYLVSNDPSCLLQIRGLLEKRGDKLKALHLAEVLNHV